MTELKDQLSLLGRKTEYKQDYAPEVLEAFDNKHPGNIEVTGIFTPRGGISIYPYANYGRPGTKYERMAEHRLMNRE